MDNSNSHSNWSSLKDYFSSTWNGSKQKSRPLLSFTKPDFDVESMTDKERISRHIYSQKKRAKSQHDGPMYDQFLVVGTRSAEEKNPEILFRYPDHEPAFQGIVGFCFPDGVAKKSLRRTPSQSSLYKLLCNYTQLLHSSNSFIFMLTTEVADVYYGVCVRCEESLEHNPLFLLEKEKSSKEENTKSGSGTTYTSPPQELNRVRNPSKTSFLISQKCYCLITRYPFFQLHFEVLYGLLAMEHVFVMSHVQTTALNEEENKNQQHPQNMPRSASVNNSRWSKNDSSAIATVSSIMSSLSLSSPNLLSSSAPVSPSPPILVAASQDQEFVAKAHNIKLQDSKLVSEPNTPNSYRRAHVRAPSLDTRTIQQKQDDYNRSREGISREVSDLLKRYREIPVPNPGQSMELSVPFGPHPLKFSRCLVDEEEDAICDYGFPITFYFLSLRHFFFIFSAALLEKKILFVCSNLRILSAIVLSFIPFLRPFIWQSILIPVLPAHLISLLDAPLPFIMGVTKAPDKPPSDVILVELDDRGGSSSITANESMFPQMPRTKEFENRFLEIYEALRRTFTKGEVPYLSTSKQLRLSKQLFSLFEKHTASLFDSFSYFCIRDLTENSTPITIFIKDAFLEFESAKGDISWYQAFMETQMFFQFQDEKVRKADAASRRAASELRYEQEIKEHRK